MKSDLPTVVVVDNSLVVTGALRSIISSCTQLQDRYNFVFVLDSRSAVGSVVRSGGFETMSLPFVELSRKASRIAAYIPALAVNSWRLMRIIDQRRARILHVNDLYNLTGVICKALRPSLRLVQHVRLLRSSYIGPAYPLFQKLVARFADEVVCVSQAVVQDFGYSPKALIRQIYDSTTFERLPGDPDPGRRPFEGGVRFLYVANYIRGKGQDLALDAFAEIADQLPGARLRFVGNGVSGELDFDFVRQLRASASESGLQNSVSFDGPSANIADEMRKSDIVLNLSTSESFSMVCLEALAQGKPLITSDCGGPREMVKHLETGVLVPNGSRASAARAMRLLASRPELAIRLGRQGYESARKTFDPVRCSDQLAAAYAGSATP